MKLGAIGENALTIVILLIFFLIAYSKLKKRSIKETMQDISGGLSGKRRA